MANIVLDGISKRYGGRRVLENFSITVEEGEALSILGPSPSGKTTVLRIISGFERPEEGEVFIGGRTVCSRRHRIFVPAEKRGVGMVFQDYAVWPHMTAGKNVAYPLKKKGVPRRKWRSLALEALRMVRLEKYEDRLPSQLSGGQQQRIAIARAMTSSGEVMLLDEPICNLDANLREEMRFEIKELQRRTGMTVVLVTQDQLDALEISDRIVVLDSSGRIRQIGTPEELYSSPVDSYVFKFMGTANFIPLQRRGEDVFLSESSHLFCNSVPPDVAGETFFAAFRPRDGCLVENGGLPVTVKRRIFLGSIYEYRVDLGGQEIRIQEDSRRAVERGLFDEGQSCCLKVGQFRCYSEIEED